MSGDTPLVIAGTYQVISRIGSGGGGIVYLAEHLRLHKKVVLKADKRNLTTEEDVLRREVDALKDLSHTYIPQVYDFVAENGVVYTVMDYIEGESFDKPLKRGERFSQTSVIDWACQLLSALDYLHSRPPHGILHADIKPSNVMLTPQGDVRLIDFNIALALREEGAVAVGSSFGYASPEHYGLDYSVGNATRGITTDIVTDLSEKTISDIKTVLETQSKAAVSSSTSSKKKIMLDVRSDIYSLGATLYHIMSSERPAQNATAVKPISSKGYSPAVISIIEKAMNPNPDLRYQTALEMLYDFEHLWDNDPRSKRHRRAVVVSAIAFSILFLFGSLTAFAGQRQMEQEQRRIAEEQSQAARLNEAYALSEYSANALHDGNVGLATSYALNALSNSPVAEAQKALADALSVYDLSDGFKPYKTVELPATPLYLKISPEGNTVSVVYAYNLAVIDAVTGDVIKTFPVDHSALSEVEYLDENVIVYAGVGGIRVFDLARGTELWTGKPGTILTVSGDGGAVAAVYKEEQTATVYDAASGQVLHEVSFDGKCQRVTVNDSFANPNDNLLALNRDGSLLAVSFSDGSLTVFDLENQANDLTIYDGSDFSRFEGGFYGKYFAFSAAGAGESVFAVVDTQAGVQTGGFSSPNPFHVQADESGVCVSTENIVVQIDPETGEQIELAYTDADVTGFVHAENYTSVITARNTYQYFDTDARCMNRYESDTDCNFAALAGGTAIVGSRDTPVLRLLTLEEHPESQIFFYDPDYLHDEARLSADGNTVMLFRYDAFRLYSIDGALLAEMAIPDAEQVYDQQYRRDAQGSRLEVIYNDGLIRSYSAQDGSLLSEIQGTTPDSTLYEEFLTDYLRVVSPLHGAPTAYNRETGDLIRELEQDAYLTYVTQVGSYVVTEYVSAQGERYGLLLNENCETLAKLSNLCDIVDEKLIFDYPTGNLRQGRVYPIEELLNLAKDEEE